MTSNKSSRFLFATAHLGGNVSPVMPVVRQLVAAGHDVRVMSDSVNRPDAEAVGARFISWRRAPNRTDRAPEIDELRREPADLLVCFDMLLGPMTEEIRAALARLVSEPSFRAAARTLGDAVAAESRASTLIADLEALAASDRTTQSDPAPDQEALIA